MWWRSQEPNKEGRSNHETSHCRKPRPGWRGQERRSHIVRWKREPKWTCPGHADTMEGTHPQTEKLPEACGQRLGGWLAFSVPFLLSTARGFHWRPQQEDGPQSTCEIQASYGTEHKGEGWKWPKRPIVNIPDHLPCEFTLPAWFPVYSFYKKPGTCGQVCWASHYIDFTGGSESYDNA